MARRTLLWMSKRSANCLEAGAIIEEETGLMNVNADTIIVACHFFLKLQLHTSSQLGNAERNIMSSILSWIFGVFWAVPINGKDVIVVGPGTGCTARQCEMTRS